MFGSGGSELDRRYRHTHKKEGRYRYVKVGSSSKFITNLNIDEAQGSKDTRVAPGSHLTRVCEIIGHKSV